MSKSRLQFHRFALLAIPALAILLLAGCTTPAQLGARPAASVMESVEIYLERHQPGPTPRLFQTTRVTDRHGKLLAELWSEGRRTWLPFDHVPKNLIDATIATEDATFYVNPGVDPARIAGAALQNAQEGEVVSGASTITMQLARLLFMGPEARTSQTMDRKMLEAGLAQELTTLFTKDELLEMYLNLLNYGHLAYGPEAAAQVYFGKPVAELSMAEATLLAGIPQQPANLDPLENWDAAKARQRTVLDLMVRHGYLSQADSDAIFGETIVLNPNPGDRTRLAPHFVQYVQDYVDQRLGEGTAQRGGLQITTTLDLELQNVAQDIVSKQVAAVQSKYDLSNGALVAMRPGSNEVVAMVGSAGFDNAAIDGQVNVATSPRQPGSAIKPVLYATAFNDNLLSPASVLWDVPAAFSLDNNTEYKPTNYDKKFHGPVTARTALANSYNVPAVKVLYGVTVARMLESARAMGIRSLNQDSNYYGLSLTLGGGEVTLLDLTTAFATLANAGTYVEPTPILQVTNSLGKPVELKPSEVAQAVSAAAAFQVTDILSDNAARTPAFGADSPLKIGRPAAAKTGTTTDFRDNWTVGFTRYLVAGVWAGNSDGHPMQNTTGLTGAAPIWHDFMEVVLADPALLAMLQAPDDPAAWQFNPPADMEQRPDCPPRLSCRQGGEYFSRQWLDAAGEAGPLADGVALAGTAPVYVDRGQGPQWTAFCQTEPAAIRPVLTLPDGLGLPKAGNGDQPAELPVEIRREQQQALSWSLQYPTGADLGPCDTLGQLASQVLEDGGQVLVDMAAAMDPNAGTEVAGAPVAVTSPGDTTYAPPAGPGSYGLAQPVQNHGSCPGNYVTGQVLDGGGTPVAGVHVVLVDQWGNRADAVSKGNPGEIGNYDFPINFFPNQYTLTIVDATGNPISAPVIVNHMQGDAGEAPCHTVIWRSG